MARIVRGAVAEPDDCRRKWKRGARAGSGDASSGAGISPARGGRDRLGVRKRPLCFDAGSGRQTAATSSAGPVRRLASQASRRQPAALSQLFALRSAFDGPLSDQREDRAEWGGWNLSAGACPPGECPRRRRAARKFCSAEWEAACGVAQRGHRSDAGSGNDARLRLPAQHGRCYGCTRLATGSIIHLPPKSAASCPPLPMAASTLLTAARPHATGWARISTTPAACRAPSSAR